MDAISQIMCDDANHRYNRHASVTRNHFQWLGQNAIASWGRAVDYDGTNGDFPRYTLVEVPTGEA